MVAIPRYIDSPPQILWWELDELILLLASMFFGVATRTLTYCLLVGFVSVWIIAKLKGGRSEGIVLHWCWWHGVPGFRLRGPSSEVREFLE